jgi:anthranilate synthase component I
MLLARLVLIANVIPDEQGEAAARLKQKRAWMISSAAWQALCPQVPGSAGLPPSTELRSNVTREQFMQAVRLLASTSPPVIFSGCALAAPQPRDNAFALCHLPRAAPLNPSPYMYFFDFNGLAGEPEMHLIGASPELHVRLEDRRATVRPIAGTRPRGKTPAEDLAFESDLLADPKGMC